MTEIPCPGLSELLAEESPRPVAAHAGTCPRCRALVRSTDARVELPGESEPEAERTPRPEPVPGAVVLVAADGADEFMPAVVLALGEEAVTVAPVSAEPELATEWD